MKPDLLAECNDQQIPPREFMGIFCKRCRNTRCQNAGWSGSLFDQRVQTQVDRLFNPQQARTEDTRFDQFRAMHFVEIPAAVALAHAADPWAGPIVHLADPPPSVATSQVVEDAVSKLGETRSRKTPAPTQVAVEVDSDPAPKPQETKPLTPTPPANISMNTEFPEEGVIIGGPSAAEPPADPWEPKAKMNIVPRGAKIRMKE